MGCNGRYSPCISTKPLAAFYQFNSCSLYPANAGFLERNEAPVDFPTPETSFRLKQRFQLNDNTCMCAKKLPGGTMKQLLHSYSLDPPQTRPASEFCASNPLVEAMRT